MYSLIRRSRAAAGRKSAQAPRSLMNHSDHRNHEKIRRMGGAKRNPSSLFVRELFMSFRDFFAFFDVKKRVFA